MVILAKTPSNLANLPANHPPYSERFWAWGGGFGNWAQ